MTARVLAAALVLGLTYQDLPGQLLAPGAPVPPELRELQRLGDLRLKVYSIHGYAPLVVFLTEAPTSASASEQRYRHQLTTSIMRAVQDQGFSLFSLNPQRPSSDSSKGDQMTQNASAMFDVFRGKRADYQPRALIGFGEGALAAARLIPHMWASPAFVALVPSMGVDTAPSAREALWANLRQALWPYPRSVLILEKPLQSAGDRAVADRVQLPLGTDDSPAPSVRSMAGPQERVSLLAGSTSGRRYGY